jgi:curved DNA-binding protein CbpA
MAADACVFCGTSFADAAHTHVCAKCGAPQPISPSQDFFNLLGVKRGFHQDLPELETRFYAISRALHPDRFAAGPDTKWKVISVERMSAVNRAYNTLTKADRLREYLLELEGVRLQGSAADGKAAIPMELAEEWFELQDAVMENPETAEAKLGEFGTGLRKRSTDLAEKISGFEREYDAGITEPKAALKKIEKLVLDGQYLKSMERDLLKLKSRLGI